MITAMNLRHITRFTYEFTNFQGWRVAISRQGTTLARYFSDKQFGSPEQARDRAIAFRDMVLDEINREPEKTRDILYKYRICARKTDPATAPLLPQTPELQPDSGAIAGTTLNMVENLRKLFQFLQLDTPGMLKLALYLLTLDTATAMPQAKPLSSTVRDGEKTVEMEKVVSAGNLQQLIDLLENRTIGQLPDNAALAEAAPPPQVPAEEIRARESTAGLHNTSPPNTTEQNLGSSRSSATSPSRQKRTASQKSSLHSTFADFGTAPNIAHHKPAQIDKRLEYAVRRATDAI